MLKIIDKTSIIIIRKLSVTSLLKMGSEKCSVAVCQFTATNSKSNNLELVKSLVSEAISRNAKFVFLPEGCDFIAASNQEIKKLSETINGPLMNEYKNLAKTNKIWLSIGGFHEANKTKLYNSHIIIDDFGDIKAVYRKLHLFDVCIPEKNLNLKESDVVESGRSILPPISSPAGALCLSLCYDLRFPELSLIQRQLGAQILTYPSAFTNATGKAHWEVLLRARAIESQCYVIAAAQYGRHNEKRVSYGQALIINPWGEIIAECPKYKEGLNVNKSIAIASIDLEFLEKIRLEMPVFQHRRNDCYQLKLLDSSKLNISDNDVFKFADKEIPGSTVFYRTKLSYAFTNIRCVVPGHVLVSSIRIASRLVDLTQDEQSDLFQTVIKVQKAVEKWQSASSSTICIQDGKYAGQTVPHVHIHILPRKQNDFKENDDIYSHLANHDRDNNPETIRNVEEMSAEAKLLRKYFT